MVFDSAAKGGDSSLSGTQKLPSITTGSDNSIVTTSNTTRVSPVLKEFPVVEIDAPDRDAICYGEPFQPGQIVPIKVPDRIVQPVQGPIAPGPAPFRPIQPLQPGRDQVLPPGGSDRPIAPFSPSPMANGLTGDQQRQILADRDKAMALRNGLQPNGPGLGPLPPSPDGRVPQPFKPIRPDGINPLRPDAQPGPERPRPSRTEFLNGEIDDAIKTASDSGRPLIISITKPNCGACTEIENEAWPGQQGAVNDNAIRLKVSSSRHREFVRQFGVSSYPTTIVVRPPTQGSRDLNVVDSMVGSTSSENLGNFLQQAFQKARGGG